MNYLAKPSKAWHSAPMEAKTKELLELLRNEIEKPTTDNPSEKVIIISAEDRRRIESAIGHNVSSSKDLADRIVRALEVRVDGMEIPLSPFLLERLRSRAIRVDWDKFVPMTIKRLLEEFCGLR